MLLGIIIYLNREPVSQTLDPNSKTEVATSDQESVSGTKEELNKTLENAEVSTETRIAAFKALADSNWITDDQSVQYAELIISGGGPPMQGVQILKGVIANNPDHIGALEMLAEMSVMSGQYDKALEKYEKLISLQPQNREYKDRAEKVKALIAGGTGDQTDNN